MTTTKAELFRSLHAGPSPLVLGNAFATGTYTALTGGLDYGYMNGLLGRPGGG